MRTAAGIRCGLAVLALLAAGAVCAQARNAANGAFLVAQPEFDSPIFRQSVILVTQGRQGDSLGLILNRPTRVTLREAFPKHKHIAALKQNVYFGGPVLPQGMLFLVRTAAPPPASVAVLRDLYIVSDMNWLDDALREGNHIVAVRVFAGHAGWAPRQLRGEMEQHAWYILPADSATVFRHKPDELWPELLRRAQQRPTAL